MVNGISNAPGRMNFTPYILLATGMNVYGSKFQTGAKLIQERTRYVDMMGVQGPGSWMEQLSYVERTCVQEVIILELGAKVKNSLDAIEISSVKETWTW